MNAKVDEVLIEAPDVSVDDGMRPVARWKEAFREWKADSRPVSSVALVSGLLGVAVVTIGVFALLVYRGIWDYTEVVDTLTSAALARLCYLGVALGALGLSLGGWSYRRVDSRRARDASVSGAVFGGIAMLLGLAILVLTRGDMETFARNFLNFADVRDYFDAFAMGIRNTIMMAGSAFAIGVVAGLPIACLLISRRAAVRAPARVFVNVVRGTPALLQLSMVYFGISLGLGVNMPAYVALIVGLGINAAAYSAEVFRAGLQSIERGQLEAARGLGLSQTQALVLVVVPQGVRRVIPPLLNEFIGLVKDTSLVAFLGVSLSERDIFSVASTGYSQYYNASFYVAAGVGYLVVTLPLIWGVNRLERRMRSGLVSIA